MSNHAGHPSAKPEVDVLVIGGGAGIEVVDGEVVALEVHDDALAGVRLGDGRRVDLEALVVAPTFVTRSAMLDDMGVAA